MLPKLAVLIDAENISYRVLPHILEEAARHGRLIVRAVYGDWQRADMFHWREAAQANGFKLRHQSSAARTKNASDMRLIMDAMDVLHYTRVEAFCLVTNDADYIPLCHKLRESHKRVIGLGYHNAADALIRSCDVFAFIDGDESAAAKPTSAVSVPRTAPNLQPLRKLMLKAMQIALRDADGWVTLASLGTALTHVQPGYRTKAYGFATLSKAVRAMPDLLDFAVFDTHKCVRLKNAADAAAYSPETMRSLISAAFSGIQYDQDGWVKLSALGSAVRKLQPEFDPKHYGHSTLSKLFCSLPDLVEVRQDSSGYSARLHPSGPVDPSAHPFG
ncbi:MAG: NYN domain-containing protein [bacterium]|nr:NYN domain-containing protein [bacterium]